MNTYELANELVTTLMDSGLELEEALDAVENHFTLTREEMMNLYDENDDDPEFWAGKKKA